MTRQVKRNLLLLLLNLWLLGGSSVAQRGVKEAELKSLFIINILNYVEWPKNKQSNEQLVCIYSEHPFDNSLEKLAQLSTSKSNGTIHIHYPKALAELTRCHILFISRSSTKELDNVLKTAEINSILTISDLNNFAEKKGMIEFVTKNDIIKLHINLSSTKAAHLNMSYLLLEIAEKVIHDKVANKE